jgi:hypothetical protein
MGLLSGNMKSYIFHNGCKNILHNIMQGCLLPTMSVMKKVDPNKAQRLVTSVVWHPKN